MSIRLVEFTDTVKLPCIMSVDGSHMLATPLDCARLNNMGVAALADALEGEVRYVTFDAHYAISSSQLCSKRVNCLRPALPGEFNCSDHP